MALTGGGGEKVVNEKTEHTVCTHEEKEDVREVQDEDNYGTLTNDELVQALKNKSDLRLLGKQSKDLVSKGNTGPRLLHHHSKHRKLVDTEDVKEKNEIRDGDVTTETLKTVQHEEYDNEQEPDDRPDDGGKSDDEEVNESSNKMLHTKDENFVEYVAVPKGGTLSQGVKVGEGIHYVSENIEKENTGDDGGWDSISNRLKRSKKLQIMADEALKKESGIDRKDALTKMPLDYDEEEATRKVETSRWLENHFGSEDSYKSHTSSEKKTESSATTYGGNVIKITMGGKPRTSGDDKQPVKPAMKTFASEKAREPSQERKNIPRTSTSFRNGTLFQGVSQWDRDSKRQYKTETDIAYERRKSEPRIEIPKSVKLGFEDRIKSPTLSKSSSHLSGGPLSPGAPKYESTPVRSYYKSPLSREPSDESHYKSKAEAPVEAPPPPPPPPPAPVLNSIYKSPSALNTSYKTQENYQNSSYKTQENYQNTSSSTASSYKQPESPARPWQKSTPVKQSPLRAEYNRIVDELKNEDKVRGNVYRVKEDKPSEDVTYKVPLSPPPPTYAQYNRTTSPTPVKATPVPPKRPDRKKGGSRGKSHGGHHMPAYEQNSPVYEHNVKVSAGNKVYRVPKIVEDLDSSPERSKPDKHSRHRENSHSHYNNKDSEPFYSPHTWSSKGVDSGTQTGEKKETSTQTFQHSKHSSHHNSQHSKPTKKYYLGENPFTENKSSNYATTHSEKKQSAPSPRRGSVDDVLNDTAATTLDRNYRKKSTHKMDGYVNDEGLTSQTLPRKIKSSNTPKKFYFGEKSHDISNQSTHDRSMNETIEEREKVSLNSRVSKSNNVNRSQSFNVTPMSTHYKSNPKYAPPNYSPFNKSTPSLNKINDSSSPLKTPGLLTKIVRSNSMRQETYSESQVNDRNKSWNHRNGHDINDLNNNHHIEDDDGGKRQTFLKGLLSTAPDLFYALHGDEIQKEKKDTTPRRIYNQPTSPLSSPYSPNESLTSPTSPSPPDSPPNLISPDDLPVHKTTIYERDSHRHANSRVRMGAPMYRKFSQIPDNERSHISKSTPDLANAPVQSYSSRLGTSHVDSLPRRPLRNKIGNNSIYAHVDKPKANVMATPSFRSQASSRTSSLKFNRPQDYTEDVRVTSTTPTNSETSRSTYTVRNQPLTNGYRNEVIESRETKRTARGSDDVKYVDIKPRQAANGGVIIQVRDWNNR